MYLHSSIPLYLLGQTPPPQPVPLPWVKPHLSPRGGLMLAEPFGWFCPLVHLPAFSFWWLETVFLGQHQGHVPQESTSAAPLLARWERAVKGLFIYGWKVSGLLIRHCLEVRLKSREQQFALWQAACFSVLLLLRWVNPLSEVGYGWLVLWGHGCPGRRLVPQPGTELARLTPVLLPCCTRTLSRGLIPVICLGNAEGIFGSNFKWVFVVLKTLADLILAIPALFQRRERNFLLAELAPDAI